jgi:hypothetical protein
MKVFLTLCALLVSVWGFSQRDLTPSSRKDAFGKRDLRSLNNYGFQFQLGATYLMSRLHNPVYEVHGSGTGFRGDFLHDPKGIPGVFGEIGMFHFPKKRSKLSLALKTVLVSYYDWGIGFKYFQGQQDIAVQFRDIAGNALGAPEITPYRFAWGHVYGRFSLHKNIHFKTKRSREKSNFFLDNSLGLNVDYRVTTKTDAYVHPLMITTDSLPPQYSTPLHVQLHYGLGFGFRLKRGAYLIPGVRAPLLSYQMTQPIPTNSMSGGRSNFGNPSIYWFNTRYWPILIHIKYMFATEKKNKNGCPPAEINDQDKDTQRNR